MEGILSRRDEVIQMIKENPSCYLLELASSVTI